MSSSSCPYGVKDIKAKTMKGCSLTEHISKFVKEGIFKKTYIGCPESCYAGDYEKCPIYRQRDHQT